MGSELVDQPVGCVHCVGLDAALDLAPHGKVLPQQHAGTVSRFVELRASDMAFDSEQVEAQVFGASNVASDLFGACDGRQSGCRPQVSALGEQAFTVDR